MALQHLRSSTADKRPDPTAMADGQLAINTNATSPGLFYKDSAGALIKAGPVHVGTTAPNASPASGGTAGNSTGEAWLDTSGSNPVLKIWNGSTWQTVQPVATGTVVSTADTGTVTSTMIADGTIVDADVNASAAIAGTKISPDFGAQNVTTTGTSTAASFIPTSSTVPTNGVYLPAANTVALSTSGVGRVFVDASGNIGVGTGTPNHALTFEKSSATTFDALNIRNGGTNSTGYAVGITGTGHAFHWNTSNAAIYFATNNTERLRITSAGLVGIGTSSPSSNTSNNANQLVVGDNTNAAERGITIGSTTGGSIRFNDGADAGQIEYNHASDFMRFVVSASTEAARFDSSGRLGIGTTSPNAILEASSSVDTTGAIRITNSNSGANANASFVAHNGTYDVAFGIGGTNYTTYAGIRPNAAFIYCNQAAGIGLTADNANGFINFVTGGSTERARIDSSGRLLVGTSSARAFGGLGTPSFQQEGTGYETASGAYTLNQNTGDSPWLILAKSRGSSLGSFTVVNSGDVLGRISFQGADGAVFRQGASITAEVDATPGSGDMPGRLVFSTTADGASSPTERMRINNVGSLRSFSDTTGCWVASGAAAGTSINAFIISHSATGVGSGTQSLQIKTNGNVLNTNNSYSSLSDIKLKENIVDASSQWDDIKALRPVNYNFKAETGHETFTQLGLIAQEVELVSPGLVTESPDRDAEGNDLGTVTKSVNYSVLYMKAVKALQEAMERIETLEAKVAALESA